jgi:hypothetical protein
MKANSMIAAGLVAVFIIAVPAARGDVKNVWLGLQGAT